MKSALLLLVVAAGCSKPVSLAETPPPPNPQTIQVVSGAAMMHAGKYQLEAQVGTALPSEPAGDPNGRRMLQAETARR